MSSSGLKKSWKVGETVQVLFANKWKQGEIKEINAQCTFNVLSNGCLLKNKPEKELLKLNDPTPDKEEEDDIERCPRCGMGYNGNNSICTNCILETC